MTDKVALPLLKNKYINSDYTIPINTYDNIIYNGSGNILTLPLIANVIMGQSINIVNLGSGNLTINTQTPDLLKISPINTSNNFILIPDGNITLTANNYWYATNKGGDAIFTLYSLIVENLQVNTINKLYDTKTDFQSSLNMGANNVVLGTAGSVLANNNFTISDGINNSSITATNVTTNSINATGINMTGISVANNILNSAVDLSTIQLTNTINARQLNMTSVLFNNTGQIQTTNASIATATSLNGNSGTLKSKYYNAYDNSYVNQVLMDGTTGGISARQIRLLRTGGINSITMDGTLTIPHINYNANNIKVVSTKASNDAPIAIGNADTGKTQTSNSIAIGCGAMVNSAGVNCIAIGGQSLVTGNNASNIIVIGVNSGNNPTGDYAVVAGYQTCQTSTPSNSVTINGNRAAQTSTGSGKFTLTPVRNLGAVTDNKILYNTTTYEFYVGAPVSDIRIKKNIEDLNDDECYNILMQIEPKKYNYIDNRTPDKVYGFIAQEVAAALPYVVEQVTDFIPDLYQNYNYNIISEILQNNDVYEYILELPFNDLLGSILRIDYLNVSYNAEVIATSPAQIKIIMRKLDGPIFIYGHQVNDFCRLNKDLLLPVIWSAMQKIIKENEELLTEVNLIT